MKYLRIVASVAAILLAVGCAKAGLDAADDQDGKDGQDPKKAATPAFSLAAGSYGSDQSFYISCPQSGASIHYTIDGSSVSASSPVYDGSLIKVEGDGTTKTVRALATCKGYANSAVGTAVYSIDYPWHTVGSEGFSPQGATYLSIAVDGAGVPYVAFNSTTDTTSNAVGKLAVWKYSGGSWSALGSDLSANAAMNTSIAIDSSGNPYVAYLDSSSSKIYVLKYDGSSWSAVGGGAVSSGSAWYPILAFDTARTVPYVFYADFSSSGRGSLRKLQGGVWTLVGAQGFTPSAGSPIAQDTSLAIASDGTPYVAFIDRTLSGPSSEKLAVMKYSSGAWSLVGAEGFSGGDASSPSLAIDGTGAPCVAYCDRANSEAAAMMRFDGASWGYVGLRGFSTDHIYTACLAFDPKARPTVAFYDCWGTASVKRYEFSAWAPLGNESFSAGQVMYVREAIDSTGIVYVVYQDQVHGSKVTVKRHLPL